MKDLKSYCKATHKGVRYVSTYTDTQGLPCLYYEEILPGQPPKKGFIPKVFGDAWFVEEIAMNYCSFLIDGESLDFFLNDSEK